MPSISNGFTTIICSIKYTTCQPKKKEKKKERKEVNETLKKVQFKLKK